MPKQLLLLLLMMLFPSVGYSADSAVVIGHTYEIAERDYVDALKERAQQVDWAKLLSPKEARKKLMNFQPEDLAKLPKATKNETYYTDPTYTLEFDMPGPDGRIMYPAGYRFNPLDYLQMPAILVVINGADPKQVEWFRKSVYAKDDRVMLMLSDGKWSDVKKKLNRDIFYLSMRLEERIQFKKVPAVAYQSGNMMEVTTYAVE